MIKAGTSTVLAGLLSSLTNALQPCNYISGNLTINLLDVYPESADFDTINCKVYVSSTRNGTLLEFDLNTSSAYVYNIPGVTGNQEFLLSGIEYSPYTKSVYISANARPAFFTNGANLTGPNEIIQFNTIQRNISRRIKLDSAVAKIEDQIGTKIGGFQDQAVDSRGNIYYMATWGNVIVKIDRVGQVSPFYIPPRNELNSTLPGFGGLFYNQDKLVVSNAINNSFYVFDLSQPSVMMHTTSVLNLPETQPSILICDSLYAPKTYNGTIALCASDFAYNRGGISVFRSLDGWRTVEYLGFIPNDFIQAPLGTATATFEAIGSIFAVVAFLPDMSGQEPISEVFPLVDITTRLYFSL